MARPGEEYREVELDEALTQGNAVRVLNELVASMQQQTREQIVELDGSFFGPDNELIKSKDALEQSFAGSSDMMSTLNAWRDRDGNAISQMPDWEDRRDEKYLEATGKTRDNTVRWVDETLDQQSQELLKEAAERLGLDLNVNDKESPEVEYKIKSLKLDIYAMEAKLQIDARDGYAKGVHHELDRAQENLEEAENSLTEAKLSLRGGNQSNVVESNGVLYTSELALLEARLDLIDAQNALFGAQSDVSKGIYDARKEAKGLIQELKDELHNTTLDRAYATADKSDLSVSAEDIVNTLEGLRSNSNLMVGRGQDDLAKRVGVEGEHRVSLPKQIFEKDYADMVADGQEYRRAQEGVAISKDLGIQMMIDKYESMASSYVGQEANRDVVSVVVKVGEKIVAKEEQIWKEQGFEEKFGKFGDKHGKEGELYKEMVHEEARHQVIKKQFDIIFSEDGRSTQWPEAKEEFAHVVGKFFTDTSNYHASESDIEFAEKNIERKEALAKDRERQLKEIEDKKPKEEKTEEITEEEKKLKAGENKNRPRTNNLTENEPAPETEKDEGVMEKVMALLSAVFNGGDIMAAVKDLFNEIMSDSPIPQARGDEIPINSEYIAKATAKDLDLDKDGDLDEIDVAALKAKIGDNPALLGELDQAIAGIVEKGVSGEVVQNGTKVALAGARTSGDVERGPTT